MYVDPRAAPMYGVENSKGDYATLDLDLAAKAHEIRLFKGDDCIKPRPIFALHGTDSNGAIPWLTTPMTAQYIAAVASIKYTSLPAGKPSDPDTFKKPMALAGKTKNKKALQKKITEFHYDSYKDIVSTPRGKVNFCARCDEPESRVKPLRLVELQNPYTGQPCLNCYYCEECIAPTKPVVCSRDVYSSFLTRDVDIDNKEANQHNRVLAYKDHADDEIARLPVEERLGGCCVGCIRYAPVYREELR